MTPVTPALRTQRDKFPVTSRSASNSKKNIVNTNKDTIGGVPPSGQKSYREMTNTLCPCWGRLLTLNRLLPKPKAKTKQGRRNRQASLPAAAHILKSPSTATSCRMKLDLT